MIERSELFPVGTVAKTHGVRGEMVVTLDHDIDLEDMRCIVFDIDSLYVPFFITSCRPRGAASDLITLDGVNDQPAAATFCGRQVFALKEDLDFEADAPATNPDADSALYLEDLIGFILRDTDDTPVGEITGYDDSTDNVLFTVTTPDGSELLVPAADDLITDVNIPARAITMDLPKGLY